MEAPARIRGLGKGGSLEICQPSCDKWSKRRTLGGDFREGDSKGVVILNLSTGTVGVSRTSARRYPVMQSMTTFYSVQLPPTDPQPVETSRTNLCASNYSSTPLT